MRAIAWALLALTSGCAVSGRLPAADSGARAQFVGGTVAGIPSKSDSRIYVTEEEFLLIRVKDAALRVRYDKVNTLEYGQRVSRRFVEAVIISPLLLLAKRRKHYLTIGYLDENGNQQALVFQVNKSDVRAVLVSLEVKTGRRVEYQDDEARKAGKG
jgi:hypothetical protein